MATGGLSIVMDGFRAAIGLPLQSPGLDSAGETGTPETESPDTIFPPSGDFDLSPIASKFPSIEEELVQEAFIIPPTCLPLNLHTDKLNTMTYEERTFDFDTNNNALDFSLQELFETKPLLISPDPLPKLLVSANQTQSQAEHKSPEFTRQLTGRQPIPAPASSKASTYTLASTRAYRGRVPSTVSEEDEDDVKFLRTFHLKQRGGRRGHRPYSPDRSVTHTINLASSKSWRQRNEYLESLKQEIQNFECENTRLRYEIHQLQKFEKHYSQMLDRLRSESSAPRGAHMDAQHLMQHHTGPSGDVLLASTSPVDLSMTSSMSRHTHLGDAPRMAGQDASRMPGQSTHKGQFGSASLSLPTLLDSYSLN